MDIYKNLVIIKNADKTPEVSFIQNDGNYFVITYNGGNKNYRYKKEDVQWLNLRRVIEVGDRAVYVDKRPLTGVETVLDFGNFTKIIFADRRQIIYETPRVQVGENILDEKAAADIFGGLRKIASRMNINTNGGAYGGLQGRSARGFSAAGDYNILEEEFKKIRQVDENSVLSSYLAGGNEIKSYNLPKSVIYPFGLNISQKQAIDNFLTSQVSIIQGPPGTGKTQTILNLIANAFMQGKNVAVVSNNNSATENVAEKLRKEGLGFLTAGLGKRENKENFLQNQSEYPPEMAQWLLNSDVFKDLQNEVAGLSSEVQNHLETQNRLAELRHELKHLATEKVHFEDFYREISEENSDTALRQEVYAATEGMSSEKIMALSVEYEDTLEKGGSLGLLAKIKLFFRYNFKTVKLMGKNSETVLSHLQMKFYEVKEKELQEKIQAAEEILAAGNLKEKTENLKNASMKIFRHKVARHYLGRSGNCHFLKERRKFTKYAFNSSPDTFVKEYPVVLSTTFSLKNSLNSDFIYDYVIVDEASQVDLVTGVLAMSCARNIAVVGDLKQLPNVVTEDDKKLADACQGVGISSMGEVSTAGEEDEYRFSGQSLLSSACLVWKTAPSVLLREHYRCAPAIIDFCNKKFYHDQLIIMTESGENENPLKLYKTPIGNHERNRMNQREIDVIKDEVLPELGPKERADVGIIAPFRNQVKALENTLSACGEYNCEIDTVHKFQGREKDVIILSSVANDTSGEFVNDPNLLNVAISRAVKKLVVVTSGNEGNENTYYGELAKYIAYNNFSVEESKTHSVFDLLYKQRYAERCSYLKKHGRISEFDSENLMYGLLQDIFAEDEFSNLSCACHVPLVNIIREREGLSEEEKLYAENPLTHTDFLVFDKMSMLPVTAIEVDGTAFHVEGGRQSERDALKNRIFAEAELPLLRLRTDGSCEKEKIEDLLRRAL